MTAMPNNTLPELFTLICDAVKKVSPPMQVSRNEKTVLELMGNKPVPYGSKKTIVPGMYFCSVVLRNDKVSFYFFPIYYHEDSYAPLIPQMIKCLKGKTCFHFKKADQVNYKELSAMLKLGVQQWKKQGYLK